MRTIAAETGSRGLARFLPRPLRYAALSLLILALLSAIHLLVLHHTPERRRLLPFPPLPPDSAPLPPLPLVEDLHALRAFFAVALDDVVEDAVKVVCVATAYGGGWALAGGTRHFALARLGGVAAVLAVYTTCDDVSDMAGDVVGAGVAWVGERLGHEPPPAEPELPPSAFFVARVANEAAEDSFKALCVWAHAAVGDLLLRRASWLSAFGQHAVIMGRLLALGVPAARYTQCNAYSDYVGDWAQFHVGALAEYIGGVAAEEDEEDEGEAGEAAALKRKKKMPRTGKAAGLHSTAKHTHPGSTHAAEHQTPSAVDETAKPEHERHAERAREIHAAASAEAMAAVERAVVERALLERAVVERASERHRISDSGALVDRRARVLARMTARQKILSRLHPRHAHDKDKDKDKAASAVGAQAHQQAQHQTSRAGEEDEGEDIIL